MDFPLRVEAISAAYKKREVIRQVSLRVKRGETLALIGPNGAGKSTLIKIIAGYVRPSLGQVKSCSASDISCREAGFLAVLQ